MKKIRDWFHNVNDIILAIVIIVIAAGVIFWRMNIIMAYPDKMAAERAASNKEISQTTDTASADDTESDDSTQDASSDEQ